MLSKAARNYWSLWALWVCLEMLGVYPQKTSWFLLVKIVDPAPQLRILFLSSSQASVETGIQLPVFQAAKFA